MKKLLCYLFAVIFLCVSVYAYPVTITWTFDQSNFDYEAFTCADVACSAVVGGPILTGNSGLSTSVVTAYNATGTTRTAFYFYPTAADDLFRAKGFIVRTSSTFTSTLTDTFNKKNSCQTIVTDISTVPAILDSGENATVNVMVTSPFSVSDSAPGSPTFRPANRTAFFGADTIVNLTITNGIGTVLLSGSQAVTLVEDEVRNVSFAWNNMPLENVTITADTQVTDSQCDLTNALTHSRSEPFMVQDLNNLPVANAGPDMTVGVNRTVTFDGTGSTDSDGFINITTGYLWDFGDGTTATGQIVTHNFTSRGNFTVTLTVTDNDGATDTDTAFVQVDGIPTAVASGPTSGFTNQLLTFNGGLSTDDGNITSFAWSFGDGGTATGSTVTHTYTTAGTFTVTLTVTDNNNLTDSDTLSVVITQQTSTGGQSSSSRRGGRSSSDKHNVRITDVLVDKTLICGTSGKAQLQLSNTGDFDEKRIGVSVTNQDLGIKGIGNVDVEESGRRLLDLRFDLPENVNPGNYPLTFEVNFGRGVDVITQNVEIQCNPLVAFDEVIDSFSAKESSTINKSEAVSPAAIVAAILVLIVIVLVLIYVFM
ncbi:PKD domain-containing protein [Candidatus Woesearchaeota archaeon]|nr:PKD domain-containing protein [Candidatus Woesearchaeota archaeon]